MNIKSEKTRGGRRIVIMLMLAAFSLALFSTPVSAVSKDPNNSWRPWAGNSDGGDEYGGAEVKVAGPPVIPYRLFLFTGYFNFTVIYVGKVESRSSVKNADISKIDYDSSSNDRRTTPTR